MIREFKPALLFVARFLALYLIANSLYALYVIRCKPDADFFTNTVAVQLSWALSRGSDSITTAPMPDATIAIYHEGNPVIRMFEGCNGVNVGIVFIAFIVAFGGKTTSILKFVLAGMVILHVANLGRLILLFVLALKMPDQFYYFHKYFFTAVLYLVVFALWFVWVKFASKKHPVESRAK